MDSQFLLRERTCVLVGPLSSVFQNLAMSLTQMGADVAFVDKDTKIATRFANQIMDSREVNEKFGRAAALQFDVSKADDKEDLQKLAQEIISEDTSQA